MHNIKILDEILIFFNSKEDTIIVFAKLIELMSKSIAVALVIRCILVELIILLPKIFVKSLFSLED